MAKILCHFMKATVSAPEIDQMIDQFRDQGWKLIEVHSSPYRQLKGFKFHRLEETPSESIPLH